MKLESLVSIPYYTMQTLNWSEKKKNLIKLLKNYPEKKTGLQPFYTNNQSDKTGLTEAFSKIMTEELNMLVEKMQKPLQIINTWSVTYKQGDYHQPHNHGSIGFAGILYLQFTKNSPETIYILPFNDYETDKTIYRRIPVQEGQIVIMPRFINHFTSPLENNKIKKIISWDMLIKR